jgi:excisionase family DNA binding protein
MTSLGKTTIYKLIKSGQLESAKVCNKRLIAFESVLKLIKKPT